MKTIHVITLLALLSSLAISCGEKIAAEQKKDTDKIPVQLLTLNGQIAATNVINVSGQFTTDDEVMLSFKTSGIIQSLLVKEGDAIKQGQLLATLNPVEIDAQVKQAQLSYDKSVRDHQRIQNLYKDSVATLEQLQNAQTAVDIAQEQLKSAQFNRSHSQIRAQANGFVLRKLASEGQMVQAGTAIFETNGAQSGNWMLRVPVSNKEWAAIRLQDKAQVEVESIPGKVFNGVISRKSEGINAANGSFIADIRLTGEKPAAIAFGMFGKAKISPVIPAATTGNGPWNIPYDALLEGDGNKGFVFVTTDNKTAHKVTVTIAGMEKDRVIISDGLQNAGSLIISGSAYLTEGSPISISNN